MATFNFGNKKDEIENILSDIDSEWDKMTNRIDDLENEELKEKVTELENEIEELKNGEK